MAVKQTSKDWREGTKRRMIAEMAEVGKSKKQAFIDLVPLVQYQRKPMVFSANVNGTRVPKPLSEQYEMLKAEIGRVYALMGKAVNADFESEETDLTPEVEIPADGKPHKPVAKGKKTVADEMEYFLSRVTAIRKFCEDRERNSDPLDDLGNRPVQAASKLIPAGIPADALLAAMVLHWPKDTRQEAGIAEFDFVNLSRQIMAEREIETITRKNGAEEIPHEMFGYVLTLCEERVPVYLYGGQGTGKSHLASQIADYLELPYGETALSAGATRGDLLGRLTASTDRPFILSKFCEIYSGGGVFNFEEIDAGLPEVLITLNNALAGSRMFNSSNGEEYEMHPDFIPIATANTLGLGATRMYVARERLDSATLDRWRMGRVHMRHDPKVERAILFSKVKG